MRDAERRLLRCIGGIDDELILEADYMRFHPKRWGHLIALAACLALIVVFPLALRQMEASPESGPGYQYAKSPEEPAANEAAGVEGAAAATEGRDQEHISLGGLTPGMTRDQVRDLLGEPDLATQAVDSDQPQSWSYEYLTVSFHDFDGSVREIRAFNGCGLSLSNGIGFDSTAEDVVRLYPDAYVTEADLDEDKYDTAYQVYPGDWTLTIGTLNGAVVVIILEDVSDPMWKALTTNEITIYQWADDQWQTTQVIDKAAKYICTVLTISEPEEASGEKTGVSMWMDFGNGTAVELLGGDRASVWTYTGDTFDPDKTDGLTYQLGGVFTGLDDYVAQALADPTATWDTDAAIHEGDAESPAEEPESEP